MDKNDRIDTHIIFPIALCEGPRDNSHFAYRSEPGTIYNTTCYVWLIISPSSNILVDAGARSETFTRRGTPEKDILTFEDRVVRYGLEPADIDIVLVTHLHCDHIALGYLYKKAKFLGQKKELQYALNPHPVDADLFDRSTFEGLNWEMLEGPAEIIPGVSVFLSPGHSPEGQSVEVSTLSGKAIITGFCCTLNTFNATPEMRRQEVEEQPYR